MVRYEKSTYLEFYDLDKWDSIQASNRICHNDLDIFVQSFIPKERKGLVTIVHGYLDHSGSLSKLIDCLLTDGYGIITFDLPGHGHSRGERGDIKNFNDYTEALHAVQLHYELQGLNDTQRSVIGHSTGAAIVLDYISRRKRAFYKTILVAPLVQPYLWSFSRIGVKIIGKKVKHIKRTFRKNSSDLDYLKFVKEDPLQFSQLPMNWLHSFQKWYDNFSNLPSNNEQLCIIQGSKDTTVDWRYNIPFLLKKYSISECILLDEGNHQLFNEREVLREITFYHIKRFLTN
ncbi:hypothetical protein AB685_01380 [Bacillus sp. LL01]|uniref:alpha/beta hydrolase n=1 Tax=Bacillus sp. LL01 TaxID=1665556 RepID=UPI00064CECAD|nr:alpha/beta hydrolase [Bacillus sp. LL01]KMJ59559.1 hypothetical protein AB685_01380 [Bacillus sp. LL01]